jgi:hypothetical protein
MQPPSSGRKSQYLRLVIKASIEKRLIKALLKVGAILAGGETKNSKRSGAGV